MRKTCKNGEHCQECGEKHKGRGLRMYKGKELCWTCYRKHFHILNNGVKINKTALTFEEALKKTYEIKGTKKNNEYFYAIVYFPKILIGHKVKLILAD